MQYFVRLTSIILLIFFVGACSTSPTGRSTLNFMSGSQLNELGRTSFDEMKNQGTVTTDPELNAYAQCLMHAIVEVLPEQYKAYNWEVAVFEEDSINAFALPGGYMGIYTGMMKFAENQHQLAAVMGHEIGHVIAEHGGERLSTNLMVTGALVTANILLSDRSAAQQGMLMAGLGLGAQVGVMLPFSRRHESEADEIGLDLMARAGFEPSQAVRLWELMGEMSGGSGSELLSTHPVPATRVKDLKKQVPSVMPLYQQRLHLGPAPNCKRPNFAEKEVAVNKAKKKS
ncbi:M48 family metallopeptidase [Aliidiomarina quisquiliarum]|uniref:M48 family metallopeptidase n=1 Tax=Aliidiomarina quisquiliarum TaxID=2938947 RepID=UPI00208F8C7B|nr:M48 family metallopeptidase [Aliidiomarina quisquiliarum]MCO4321989.1 M48 family metallopeptidase [Aliidiomarina quisquiliarum]